MKSENYTFILIPNDERDSKTFYFSKRGINAIFLLIGFVIIAAICVVSYFIIQLPEYNKVKKNHAKFISERMKILELKQDLNRLKQMDNLIRNSLGATIDIKDRPIISDSLTGAYEMPRSQISYTDNIPSQAPIKGFISQRSGADGLFSKKSHYGIDIIAKEGDPFVSAAKGMVVFSGWTYEFGNVIILYHGNDYFTYYGHNKKNLKSQWDIVERGEVIGMVGSTGVSSGPHLHFEIWKEFSPINPLDFFPEYQLKDLTVINE